MGEQDSDRTSDSVAVPVLASRKVGRDELVTGTALIEQTLWVNISTKIVLPDYDMLCGSSHESRIRPARRRNENHAVCLRFVRLIVEAAIA